MTKPEPYFPLAIDSSTLSQLKSCPQKFFYEHIEDWKGKEPNVHLHAGGAFAEGMRAARTSFYAEGTDSETAIATGLKALIEYYGDFECPSDSAKSLERMLGAFEFYFTAYPLVRGQNEPILIGEKMAIEYSFAHPLPIKHPVTGDPLIYCGRMDAILHFADAAFTTDEKTTSSLGGSWSRKWDLRGQFTGYAWGCRESGIEVAGTLVRGISILKTKFETQQAVVYSPSWQINRWYEQACDAIEDALAQWKRGWWRMSLDEACVAYGGCIFKDVCLSQSEESKASQLSTFFERRRWNPLVHVESKVD